MKLGEQSAIAQCYELFSPMIYTAIYKICKNPAVADDLLHDTFIDALENLAQIQDDKFFLAWLKKIAFNNTFNYIKRQNVFSKVKQKISLQLEQTHSFTQQVNDQNQLELLLGKVSEQHRLILWLFIVEQYTHEEIAELTNKTVSFSKSVVHRALKKLNCELKKEEQGADNAY
jgi:RNA polymerase sigma-70 factor (ECF subfamily)